MIKKLRSSCSFALAALVILMLLPGIGRGQVNIAAGNTINETFTIGATATATLPTGWKIDAISTARTLGTYSAATNVTAQTAGANMSSSATSGKFNFGAGTDNTGTDRAIGGLSASSSNRSVNLYVDLLNNGSGVITSFIISYNVEKYRTGTNAAGYSIQMYYSTDGTIWTTAGSDFLTSFSADATTAGYATTPGVTTSISSKTLTSSVNASSHLYLAWQYTVNSGTSGSSAQALGIDDVSITANAAAVTPTISIAPTSLSNYTYYIGSGPSTEKTFSISGTNLTEGISIDAPVDYEISTGTGVSFVATDPIPLSQTGGTVAATTIYTRLKAGLTGGLYNGEVITATSAAADNKTVTCSGEVTVPVTLPYAESFTDCGTQKWTSVSVASTTNWTCGSGYQSINGFGGGVASNDYLVSPVFNLDSYSNEVLTFESYNQYADVTYPPIELLYTTNYTGNPATTSWTTHTATWSAQNSLTVTPSGDIDISGISGTKVQFAFHYISSGTGSGTSSLWRIDNISLSEVSLSSEPSNNVTGFSATANSPSQITVNWTDAITGVQAPSGYLVMINETGSFTDPVDGTAQVDDLNISDGSGVKNIGTGVQTYQWSSLNSSTPYFFKIFSYNGSGATINYKTDGIVPTSNGTTPSSNATTSEIAGPGLASQPFPMFISSLKDTDAEAVRVFDMDMYDYGTDGLSTKVTQLTIIPGIDNSAFWTQAIQGVKLSIDGGNTFITTGVPVISDASIVIPIVSGDLVIPDNDAITVSMLIYLNTVVTDNTALDFQVAAADHGCTADPTGSTFATNFTISTDSYATIIDVVSTKLQFVQQPTSTVSNSIMAPAVTVEALDANNNIDIDNTGVVSITSSGTLSGVVTASLTSGFGTAGNIVHTVSGDALTLTASLTGLTSATSNTFNIASALTAGDILFLGYGTDTPDKFAFLVMKTISGGTQISFTDNAWTGTALTTNESTGIYASPALGLAKGSIITIEGTTVSGGGTMSAGLTGLSASGDQILAYQGSSLAPSFIAGVSSTGWISTGTTTSNSSYLPSPLAVYINAVSFSSEEDNGYYSGPSILANGAIAAFICNSANWTRSTNVQTFPSWSFTIGTASVIDVVSSVQDLTINVGETMSVNSDKVITVSGTLTNSAGTFGLVINSGGSLINNSPSVSATVNRTITDAANDKWHLFISPINENVQASAGSCFDGAYVDGYNESTAAWERLATDANVTPDEGYFLNYLAGSRDLVFPGTLKSSPVSYSNLSYTPSSVVNDNYGAGWHLVGNPYPCGINTASCNVPTGMNAFAYVWDGANFVTHTIGSADIAGTIASLQGFFVRTNDASNSLTLDNLAKVSGGVFYKNSNSVPQILSLSIEGNNYSDKTYVRFNPSATENFDQSFDAYKRAGLDAAPQLYSILPGEKAAVNTLPDYTANPNVALGLKVGTSTTYTINVSGIGSFDARVPMRLDDLKTGLSQDLRLNPVYSFTAEPGDAENRFMLSFGSITGLDKNNTAGINMVSTNGIICVTHNVPATGTVYLYSVSGQLLATSNLNAGETTMRAASTGVYLVKVVTGKTSLTRKMVVVQ